jgi:hypothetical protein
MRNWSLIPWLHKTDLLSLITVLDHAPGGYIEWLLLASVTTHGLSWSLAKEEEFAVIVMPFLWNIFFSTFILLYGLF